MSTVSWTKRVSTAVIENQRNDRFLAHDLFLSRAILRFLSSSKGKSCDRARILLSLSSLSAKGILLSFCSVIEMSYS